MNETQPKWIFTSKTIWGGIIAILVGVVPALGYLVTEGDIQALNELFDNILAVIAGVITIHGRIKAKQPISTTLPTTDTRQGGHADWGLLTSLFAIASIALIPIFMGGCSTAREAPVIGPVVEWLTPDDVCEKKFKPDAVKVNACRIEISFQAEYNRIIKAFNSATTDSEVRALAEQRRQVDAARLTLRSITNGTYLGDPEVAVTKLTRKLEQIANG